MNKGLFWSFIASSAAFSIGGSRRFAPHNPVGKILDDLHNESGDNNGDSRKDVKN